MAMDGQILRRKLKRGLSMSQSMNWIGPSKRMGGRKTAKINAIIAIIP